MSMLSEIAGRLLRLPAPASREVSVEPDLAVEMDDGVILLADRWSPPRTRSAPTVLIRSPYGRKGAFGFLFGRMLAERGLQAVVQSVRGTFGSGGRFDPFDEREDGLATLRWLRAQPWHRGGVGMTGPSYMGLVQWAIADQVDALSPSVTASQFRGMTYGAGTISLASAMSWMLLLEVQERRLAPLLVAHGLRRTLPRLYHQTPIADADIGGSGERVPLGEWLEELAPDSPSWGTRDYSTAVADVTAPVQMIGGWYDIFLPWLIEDFSALRAAGRSPQLVVGPWNHLAPDLAAYSLREGIAWLRAHLLGDRRMLSPAPVRVFLTGAGRWLELDDWPPADASGLRLHLEASGGLSATAPGDDAGPSRYRYDPTDPTPVLGGPLLMERRPVRDNRELEARPDVLTFTAEPLAEALDAIGPVEADVWMRSTRADTDLFVRICDVDAEGASWNVCDALLRLTAGAPERDADGIARVRFELWPVAHRFLAGHRIRVQISSGAHPRYARNPGTGEDPLRAIELVAADQEIFHDSLRPSAVTLSVAGRGP